jgi:capsid protein
MARFDMKITSAISAIKSVFIAPQPKSSVLTEDFALSDYSNEYPLYYDGEKTPYELGTPKNYILDYYALRARAWQSYIESDIVQNAIRKYCLWVIGPGLKLQATPNEYILNKKGIKKSSFIQDSENQFRLFAEMNEASYSGMDNLHGLAAEALKNALLAGDVLIVQRFDGIKYTTEIIDGYHIKTPYLTELQEAAEKRGNRIIHGVEVNAKKTHVAFYVQKSATEFERVEAKGSKTGQLKAWLFYGLKHKIDDIRGMSLLSAILETAAKMDRYKDATLGSAEENAKIPYSIEHNQFSTGENPLVNSMIQSFGKGKGTAPETQSYQDCENVATKVALSTGKKVYNMPVGSTIRRNSGNTDNRFGEFFGVNIDIVYATIGIPAEVAMEKFGGSYSSSRAALKSWEYTMITARVTQVKKYYYQPIYTNWLDVNVLQNNVNAPGYLKALQSNDLITLQAYRNSRFIGATVPHIDPVKEVMAERKKLGKSYDNYPITTGEQAAENLNTGDYDQIIKKAENEKQISKSFDDAPDSTVNSGTSQVS